MALADVSLPQVVRCDFADLRESNTWWTVSDATKLMGLVKDSLMEQTFGRMGMTTTVSQALMTLDNSTSFPPNPSRIVAVSVQS